MAQTITGEEAESGRLADPAPALLRLLRSLGHLFLLALTFSYFYHDPGWNGNSRFGLTFALVQEGRLAIDSFHDREGTETGDKSFYQGHYYSDKAIGASLVAAVFYLPLHALRQLPGLGLDLGWVKYLLTFFTIGLPRRLPAA
jgi:hypothetical protein